MASVLLMRLIMMLVYAVPGFLLYKYKLITNEGVRDIGKLLLYIILPAAIIKSYDLELSLEMARGLLLSFALSVLCLILAVVLSRVVYRGKKPIEEFGSAFSNAGFMGIPLVTAVIGSHAVCYAAAFVALLNVLQWTYGIFVMTGNKEAISPKKILFNPILISFALGVLLFVLPFRLPAFFSEILTTISAMNAPIAMLTVGAYLAQVSIKEMFTRRDGYFASAIRLVAVPVATSFLLWILPFGSAEMKLATMILAAAPIGSNVAVYAQLYGGDYKKAVQEVVLSTVLSVATMPLVIGLFETIL